MGWNHQLVLIFQFLLLIAGNPTFLQRKLATPPGFPTMTRTGKATEIFGKNQLMSLVGANRREGTQNSERFGAFVPRFQSPHLRCTLNSCSNLQQRWTRKKVFDLRRFVRKVLHLPDQWIGLFLFEERLHFWGNIRPKIETHLFLGLEKQTKKVPVNLCRFPQTNNSPAWKVSGWKMKFPCRRDLFSLVHR